MKHFSNIPIVIAFLLALIFASSCEKTTEIGFLHSNGKRIVDAEGRNFLIRGLGPGGWMLQEGYMFHTKVGTQHEIRKMLQELTDKETTDKFYEDWLEYFFTRKDVELTKQWGFNSIRVPIHYQLFTPAIENEPVSGEITWKKKGFEMLDSLLSWCTDNEIYLMIDLHAAPGGQGTNASISDYDETKPSLWESEDNIIKTIALWRKLADRYKNEPFIGGYDLLNETNWAFEGDGKHPNGCDCERNIPLLKLFERTITAIREVDVNHIIFIEGNCWSNNFKGMHSLAKFDDNLVFSFHKYWNWNEQKELKWIIDLRDSLNVPIYLGETGENSNSWFSDMVDLVEANNIGWSQWAYKQMDNDDPFTIVCPKWKQISDYNPKTNENKPNKSQASEAMLAMIESIKTENCRYNFGVVNAYLEKSEGTQAYKNHAIPGIIYASEYDDGKRDLAWSDQDYHFIHSAKLRGNKGGVFRNDGVDIRKCEDDISNGFCVGWTEDGEWLKYSIASIRAENYKISIRVKGKPGKLSLMFSSSDKIHSTEFIGSDTWMDIEMDNVELSKNDSLLTLKIDEGGFDINYLKFEAITQN